MSPVSDHLLLDPFVAGDDTVFGSRSYFQPSDNEISAPIVIGAGAMIADRCVMLPGVQVREGVREGGSTEEKEGAVRRKSPLNALEPTLYFCTSISSAHRLVVWRQWEVDRFVRRMPSIHQVTNYLTLGLALTLTLECHLSTR